MIWCKPYTLEDVRTFQARRGTMADHLGIEFVEVGPNFLKARMPVHDGTRQPYGLLHGGASVALAETVTSLGATRCIDPERYGCFGQEINANHVRAVADGHVCGVARPLHLGRRSHVWNVHNTDSQDCLICISRMTAAVVEFTAPA
jgi:1,4-dihydroxy-2-naphthoyl-CoA hydrolase